MREGSLFDYLFSIEFFKFTAVYRYSFSCEGSYVSGGFINVSVHIKSYLEIF